MVSQFYQGFIPAGLMITTKDNGLLHADKGLAGTQWNQIKTNCRVISAVNEKRISRLKYFVAFFVKNTCVIE